MGDKSGGGGVEETAYDKALAEIAGQELMLSEEIMRPIEDYVIDDVRDVEGREAGALDVASVENRVQFGRAKSEAADIVGSRGVGVGAGAGQNLMGEFSIDQGQSAGLTAVDTKQAVQDDYLGNLDALAAYGSGQATDGLAGLSAASDIAASQASNDVRNSLRDKQINAGAVGGLAGVGYGLYTSGDDDDDPEDRALNQALDSGRLYGTAPNGDS